MKSLLLLTALLFAAVVSTSPSVTVKAARDGKKQQALTTFTEPVRLQGVMLKGEYLFVHDDEAMARGETCTFVYKGTVAKASKLVASFHCTPAERTKVSSFTVRIDQVSPGVFELREFQFGGDTESHVVPAAK